MSTDPALPNRAARRAAARKSGKGRKLAALGSGAVLASGAAGMAVTLSATPTFAAATFTVDDTSDTGPVAGDCTDITPGNCSLRDAIAAANVDAVEDVITFAPSVSGSTITLVSDLEAITEAVDITGPGAALLTVDGDTDYQVFAFTGVDSGSPSITGLTVAHGYDNGRFYDDSGGGIALYESDATFTFDALVLNANKAYNDGGGLWCIDGDADVLVSNSTFSFNETEEGGGGGLYFDCDHLTVTNSTFTKNFADDNGGGLYADGDELTLTNTTITGNESDGSGAGITLNNYTSTVSDSTITGNTSGSRGGGIAIYADNATVSNTTISGNTADEGGGVSAGYYSGATILSSTISGNIGVENGGGVFVGNDLMTIANSTIANNEATRGNGGGIAVHGFEFYVSYQTFEHFDSSLNLFQTTVSGNTAGNLGDGLYLYAPTPVPLRAGAAAPPKEGKNAANEAEDKKADRAAHAEAGVGADSVGTITINGTIISANVGGEDIATDDSESVTANHSLFGGVGSNITVAGAGNQTGVNNPGLGALADNGGPTQTMALLTGSPAIDTGPVPPPAFLGNGTDQRGAGFARVVNGVADIGAFELQLEALFTG